MSKSSKTPTSTTPNPEDRVYTREDLSGWNFNGVALAVLGCPVKHSASPAMHNAALSRMAAEDPRFQRWRYFKFEIPPEDLGTALPQFRQNGFFGLNLTVPHKILAVSLIDRVAPEAHTLGAVNTLRALDKGGYEGTNTDGYGLETALREELGVDPGTVPVILLGAGGAARAAAVQCLLRGCPELYIGNRTFDKLAPFREELAALGQPGRIETFDPATPPRVLPPGALLLNCTAAGLRPGDPPPVDLEVLAAASSGLKVFDMIYNPPETPLLREARRLGLPRANGLSMLVHQGARSLEFWAGRSVPVEAMKAAVMIQ